MTKQKSTKRALLLSALSLLMCVSMLIGSTFAWFTDSVTSGNNKIVAGNLDVALYHTNGTDTGEEVTDTTKLFDEVALWEPGAMVWEKLTVRNLGSLALKYTLSVNVSDVSVVNGKSLADVLKVAVMTEQPTRDNIKTATTQDLETFALKGEGVLDAKTGVDTFYVAIYWAPTADDNDYNIAGEQLYATLGVNLLATQATVEKDSFDDQYDKDATYPAKNLKINTDKEFVNACKTLKAGDSITLLSDITLSEQIELPAGIILNGNGKQINGSIYAGGDLTIAGHTKVASFSASYYSRTINIEQGACLEVTGTSRVTLGYDNVFNIVGNLADAKNTDKTTIQPSLIIPGGMSITGGNDATINVTNAYIKVGGTSSKNNAANGTFSLNFTNSIVDFTNQFTLSEPTSGKNPTFKIAIKDSVLTTATKLCVAAANSTIVIDNSDVILGTYLRNSGNITLKNKSTLKGQTIQFGENGGNNGTIIVDNSKFTINANSTGQAFDGKCIGEIVLKNGATALVDYYKDMTITHDATSTFTGTEVN